MVKMAASDDDSRSEVSEILASCDNTSPKKKEPDMDQNSETSSDPFEVILTHYIFDHLSIRVTFQNCSPVPSDIDEEDVRQSVAGTKKHSFGKTWKNNKGEYIRYRCYDNNVEYKIGDNVFIESQRPDQPFYICNITEFKKSKRDAFVVVVRWFYRTTEVPETVYNFLIKDRYTEHGMNAIHDPLVKSRELFISNATDQFPINVLRGKCAVTHCTDIMAVKQFHPDDDAFFYTLSYNPETRRLASTQGEIRVGTSHQAKLPPWEGEIPPIGRPDRYEELSWEPGRTHDHDLLMYLRAARSMAAFAGMCDGGSTDDGCFAASKDDTTANALDVLHDCDYDTGAALQKLVEDPVPVGHDKQWTEDETRRFIKGLRIHGKNFYKIRTEFLPEKDTGELITFYYLWKKTPGAAGLRPRGRRHRPAPAVLQRKVKTEKAGAGKKKETSSASEVEDSEGENSREQNPYYCRHCSTTTSKDWHHGGKDMKLLCTACRQYYKRYGEMPLLPGTARSQFTFRPISPEGMAGSQEDEDSEGRGLDNRLSPVSQEAQDRGEESDSGRSYTSSRSESGSRSPEEDGSRATTPGTGAQSSAGDPAPAGNSVKQPMLPPATAVSAPAEAAVDTSIDLNASQTEPHNLSVGGQSQPPTVSVLPSVQVVPSLSQPPATLGAPLPPPLFSQPGSVVGDQPLALPLTSGARTPVDLSSPSPGPQPEVQVLEPEPEPPTTPHSPGPPSPELKIEDTECHRSQSAIFVRHYNRGEGNSCSRTDMFFKPVPDSKLARKREERLRRQEEKERKQEERSTSSAGSHPGMSPGLGRRPGPSPGHVTPGSYNIHELDRLEREKRERELAEHRDRENRSVVILKLLSMLSRMFFVQDEGGVAETRRLAPEARPAGNAAP